MFCCGEGCIERSTGTRSAERDAVLCARVFDNERNVALAVEHHLGAAALLGLHDGAFHAFGALADVAEGAAHVGAAALGEGVHAVACEHVADGARGDLLHHNPALFGEAFEEGVRHAERKVRCLGEVALA